MMEHSTIKKKDSRPQRQKRVGIRPDHILPFLFFSLLIISISIAAKLLISFNRLLFFSLPTREELPFLKREKNPNEDYREGKKRAREHAMT